MAPGVRRPDLEVVPATGIVQQRLVRRSTPPRRARSGSSASAQDRGATSSACSRGHERAARYMRCSSSWTPITLMCARARAAAAGLGGVAVLQADAALTAVYRDAVPADVLVLCGIFGNVSDEDIDYTVRNASRLCAPGATVLWTRGRWEPDLTPTIRRWFNASGFEELAFDSDGPTVSRSARTVSWPTRSPTTTPCACSGSSDAQLVTAWMAGRSSEGTSPSSACSPSLTTCARRRSPRVRRQRSPTTRDRQALAVDAAGGPHRGEVHRDEVRRRPDGDPPGLRPAERAGGRWPWRRSAAPRRTSARGCRYAAARAARRAASPRAGRSPPGCRCRPTAGSRPRASDANAPMPSASSRSVVGHRQTPVPDGREEVEVPSLRCVACTAVVRGPRTPRSESQAVGDMPVRLLAGDVLRGLLGDVHVQRAPTETWPTRRRLSAASAGTARTEWIGGADANVLRRAEGRDPLGPGFDEPSANRSCTPANRFAEPRGQVAGVEQRQAEPGLRRCRLGSAALIALGSAYGFPPSGGARSGTHRRR